MKQPPMLRPLYAFCFILYALSMEMPPLKDKPRSPAPPLPVPRRKGRAALFVIVPAVTGAVVGAIVGAVVDWAFGNEWVWMFAGAFGIFGAFIGIRTLFMVLSYGATHTHDPHDAAHQAPDATHRE